MLKIPFAKPLFWFALAAVLILSMIPGSNMLSVNLSDKILHFSAFLALAILLCSAYVIPKPYLSVLLLLAVFGISIEVIQYFVPYRSFSLADFVADIAGILTGLLLYRIAGMF